MLKDLVGEESVSSQVVLGRVGHSIEVHSALHLPQLMHREFEKELLMR
jgi:hypothetical protein